MPFCLSFGILERPAFSSSSSSWTQPHFCSFPETMPHEFVEEVLEAADENKDGLISVDEMQVLLRNLYSHQPLLREEVHFIMERDLDMPAYSSAVPMEKVKKLLLEINH